MNEWWVLAAVAVVACNSASTATPDAPVLPGLARIPLGAAAGNNGYTAQMSVGDQVFTVEVDTGSGPLGVGLTGCTSCRSSNLYVPGAGAMDLDASITYNYASGSWTGEVYRDRVALPGVPSVVIDFGAIESQGILLPGVDGILGLGPDDLLAPHTTSYLDAAIAAGEQAEMAFRLCSDGGDMWLGGFDPSAAATTVAYTPLLPPTEPAAPYYDVQIAGMALGNSDLGFTAQSFGDVVIDTGSGNTLLPDAVLSAFASALDADPAYQQLFPGQPLTVNGCISAGTVTPDAVDAMLPPLRLTFPSASGAPFAVAVSPMQSYMNAVALATGSLYCLSMGSSQASNVPTALLGEDFLHGMLTVFDIGNAQVGFAPVAGCTASSAFRPQATRRGPRMALPRVAR